MFDNRYLNTLYRYEMPVLASKGFPYCPLKEVVLSGNLDGPLGNLKLRQVFRGTGEDPEKPVEAVYRFPLPGDAVVRSVEVTFGDVRIETTLTRRETALEDYQEATREGRQAVLLEKEGLGIFTLRVSGIRPGEDVTIETGFLLWLRPWRGASELRVPLTLAPRYFRVDESIEALRREPLAVTWDPGYRFSLELECRGLGAPEGVTHPLKTESLGTGYRLFLEEPDAFPDQDCVIRFPVEAGEEGISLRSFGWKEEGKHWFLALVQAPETSARRTVPREIILLVDRSGSMSGPKSDAAYWAARGLLSRLGEDEVFNVGYFNNEIVWLNPRGLRFGKKNIEAALEQLKKWCPRAGRSSVRSWSRLSRCLEARASIPVTSWF